MDETTAPEGAPSLRLSYAGVLLGRGRPEISRSFRLHRPRGAFCGSGYCHQCSIRASHGEHLLACETEPDQTRPPSRVDPLRPVGLLAERMPPWFYEHRFARPRWLRQTYLGIMRSLSAAPRLPQVPRPRSGSFRELETDVLVVGGGPAGIAAAGVIAALGDEVTLVEREAELGGSSRFVPSRWRGLLDHLGRLRNTGVRVLTGATCLGLYAEEGIAVLVSASGPAAVRFARLVVATGAYDRPLPYAGNDLPGTIGIRAFERFLAQGAIARRSRIGVFAAPEEAARAAAAARESGVSLSFLAGPAELPDCDAPTYPATRLLATGGRGRVRWADVEQRGRHRCDVFVLGFTQPTYELQVHAGSVAAVRGSPGAVVPEGDPSIPVLVVGEAAGHLDPTRIAGDAARAAAAWGRGETLAPVPSRHLPEPARRAPDAFVCLCEDVRVRDVEAAVGEGFDHAELVKRRTGAGTGPCQGKLCLGELATLLDELGVEPGVPTVRPPTRPVPIAALAINGDD